MQCQHSPSSAKYSTNIITNIALPYEMAAGLYRLSVKPGPLLAVIKGKPPLKHGSATFHPVKAAL